MGVLGDGPSCPRLDWLARFSGHLMRIRPDIDATRAGLYAECAFVAGGHDGPEAVADGFIGPAPASVGHRDPLA